jgi:hypothetical protein
MIAVQFQPGYHREETFQNVGTQQPTLAGLFQEKRRYGEDVVNITNLTSIYLLPGRDNIPRDETIFFHGFKQREAKGDYR